MSPMWTKEAVAHFRVVWCGQCTPDWFRVMGRNVMLTHKKARDHARKFPGHAVSVIDIETLSVDHRYQFDALPADPDAPPF
jgi:hypothetical protein